MGQHVRVLIADDNVRARAGLRALFATWPSVTVVGEAVNGYEAVQLAGLYQPDVVLMDVQMPVLDGVQATKMIKQQWPTILVVILTMYAVEHHAARNAGADICIIKGGPPDRLMAALGAVAADPV